MNNDKALAALKEYLCYQDCDDAPLIAERILQEYAGLFAEALTPQSSADLGRVRYVLERCLHFKTNDGQQKLITEALRILDEVIGRE